MVLALVLAGFELKRRLRATNVFPFPFFLNVPKVEETFFGVCQLSNLVLDNQMGKTKAPFTADYHFTKTIFFHFRFINNIVAVWMVIRGYFYPTMRTKKWTVFKRLRQVKPVCFLLSYKLPQPYPSITLTHVCLLLIFQNISQIKPKIEPKR